MKIKHIIRHLHANWCRIFIYLKLNLLKWGISKLSCISRHAGWNIYWLKKQEKDEMIGMCFIGLYKIDAFVV